MTRPLLFFFSLFVACTATYAGSARAYHCQTAYGNVTVLENDFVKITIADTGGRVTGWYLKGMRKDIAVWSVGRWAVLAQRIAVFADSIMFPDEWPTAIGVGLYQTEILPPIGQTARVKQSLTLASSSTWAGLRIEKTYTLAPGHYEVAVDYVLANTRADTLCYRNKGSLYGLHLTVESAMRCGPNYLIAFKSEDTVFSGPFPNVSPNPQIYRKIDWCAIEERDSGYAMGLFYDAALTYGIWPGEERPDGRDFEIVFRPVIYPPGHVERYHFTICGGPGSIQTFRNGELSTPTYVELKSGAIPEYADLGQNYPNPFNPWTTIRYELPQAVNVSLRIYNTLGQIVTTLVDETKGAGVYQAQWNAAGVSSGVYIYRLLAGEYAATGKMLLVK